MKRTIGTVLQCSATDEVPYSQNFLESQGFEFSDDPIDLGILRLPGEWTLVLRRDYSLHLDRIHLRHVKTCGQVRQLLRLLTGK